MLNRIAHQRIKLSSLDLQDVVKAPPGPSLVAVKEAGNQSVLILMFGRGDHYTCEIFFGSENNICNRWPYIKVGKSV